MIIIKNKNTVFNFQLFSFMFVSILGTLLHFTYEWSNNNQFVGLFSAVNESTWEHLKLIFFPMLITTIIGYFYIGKTFPNFLCAKTLGILISILFTITFFYTYTGVLGTNIDFINILTFFLGLLLGEYVTYRLMLSSFTCNKVFYLIILIILLLCFMFFTYNPPQIGLFQPPSI